MSTKSSKSSPKIHVAEVVRYGDKIILPSPDKMTLSQAVDILRRKIEFEEEETCFSSDFDSYPWDGGIALAKSIEEKFGVCLQQPEVIDGFFGSTTVKPRIITVGCGYNERINIPWGRFSLPAMNGGYVETKINNRKGGCFSLYAECKRKYEPVIRDLFDMVEKYIAEHSIYKGKAFEITFEQESESGEDSELPEITFLESNVNVTPIFSVHIEKAINTNILTPIKFTESASKIGVPMKRGVLLAGEYGTGKTLMAAQIRNEAVKSGWTFIYVRRVCDIAQAIAFARRFQPVVLFAEDIDSVMGHSRSSQVNEILNVIDGISSKSDKIMIVLTSNHPENINAAMRRKGRIDITIPITPPDAEASARLIRTYGGNLVEQDEDLTSIGSMLSGSIPAVIREVVERSKLEALRRTFGDINFKITQDDLISAGTTLLSENDLFAAKNTLSEDERKIAARELMAKSVHTLANNIGMIASKS